jgi:hypothetical protein
METERDWNEWRGAKEESTRVIAQGSRVKANKYSIIGTSPTSLSMSNFKGPFNPFFSQQHLTNKQIKERLGLIQYSLCPLPIYKRLKG